MVCEFGETKAFERTPPVNELYFVRHYCVCLSSFNLSLALFLFLTLSLFFSLSLSLASLIYIRSCGCDRTSWDGAAIVRCSELQFVTGCDSLSLCLSLSLSLCLCCSGKLYLFHKCECGQKKHTISFFSRTVTLCA